MALIRCPECGREVSDQAPACVGCGRPIAQGIPAPQGSTESPKCKRMITPVIINVGGGSCDLGMRERWTCPACMSVIYRKGCFVATTTYGDEDIVEVRFLRAFRDEILQEAGAGRVLIKAYYRWGPLAAQWVEAVPGLKRVARWSLDRVISGIEAFTELRRDRFRS